MWEAGRVWMGMGKESWNKAIKMHGFISKIFILDGEKSLLDLKHFEYTCDRDC